MFKSLTWNHVVESHKRMVAEYGLKADDTIYFHIVLDNQDTQTKSIYFKNFLPVMWRLFDSNLLFRKMVITKEKGGEVIYSYDHIAVKESMPTSGNGDIILGFKDIPKPKREVYIDILLHQILEDNTCSQNNTGPS